MLPSTESFVRAAAKAVSMIAKMPQGIVKPYSPIKKEDVIAEARAIKVSADAVSAAAAALLLQLDKPEIHHHHHAAGTIGPET